MIPGTNEINKSRSDGTLIVSLGNVGHFVRWYGPTLAPHKDMLSLRFHPQQLYPFRSIGLHRKVSTLNVADKFCTNIARISVSVQQSLPTLAETHPDGPSDPLDIPSLYEN